jgi:hypothetical protein
MTVATIIATIAIAVKISGSKREDDDVPSSIELSYT